MMAARGGRDPRAFEPAADEVETGESTGYQARGRRDPRAFPC